MILQQFYISLCFQISLTESKGVICLWRFLPLVYLFSILLTYLVDVSCNEFSYLILHKSSFLFPWRFLNLWEYLFMWYLIYLLFLQLLSYLSLVLENWPFFFRLSVLIIKVLLAFRKASLFYLIFFKTLEHSVKEAQNFWSVVSVYIENISRH